MLANASSLLNNSREMRCTCCVDTFSICSNSSSSFIRRNGCQFSSPRFPSGCFQGAAPAGNRSKFVARLIPDFRLFLEVIGEESVFTLATAGGETVGVSAVTAMDSILYVCSRRSGTRVCSEDAGSPGSHLSEPGSAAERISPAVA